MPEKITYEYKCKRCSYFYIPKAGDPGQGIDPNTAFEDLPDSWVCPVCGAKRDMFKKIG